MNLGNLVKFLLTPEQLGELFNEMNVDLESETLLIYMKDSLSLESEVAIFSIEETEDYIQFKKDNVNYYQLFPVETAIELIETDLNLKNKGYSDLDIARRLLDYRFNDA